MDANTMSSHGAALLAYYRGEQEHPLLVRRDDGLEAPLPMAFSFRSPAEFTAIENAALELCRGTVLDVGGGSGLHALALQERGVAVTAIDIDPQAVEVMRGRGVVDARQADMWQLAGERFDTVLMLGHGIGLAGNMAGLVRFLARARDFTAEGGQLVFDSSDPAHTDDPRHLAYHEANRRAGRYLGETRICLVHDGVAGPFFGWLLLDPDTLAREAERAGWRCEVVLQEPTGEYLARLTR